MNADELHQRQLLFGDLRAHAKYGRLDGAFLVNLQAFNHFFESHCACKPTKCGKMERKGRNNATKDGLPAAKASLYESNERAAAAGASVKEF